MRAAVFEDIKKLVYREDYPKPTPGPDDALVKVHYCGICGSDITNYVGKLFQTPLIMGHELAGEVVELGENISGFNIRDRVVGINVQLDVFKGELRGLGIFDDGGFAEFVKVPKEFLFHAPKTIPFEECTLVESVAIGVRGMKLSKIGSYEKIAIIGGGNIGLTTLSVLLSERDPEYIIVIEPHQFLRERAVTLGATVTFPPSKAKLRKFFKENGAPSYIFECAGTEKAFMLALDMIKRGGTITLEGMYRGKVSFPLMMLNTKEIGIKGVISHSSEDIHDAIELFEKKKIALGPLISEIVSLKEIEAAFNKFLEPGERKFIKIVVKI